MSFFFSIDDSVIKEEGEVDDDEEDEADAGSRSRSDENAAAAAAATASASAPTDAAEAAGYTRLTGRCDDAEESDVVDRCSSSSSDLSFGGSSSGKLLFVRNRWCHRS